MSRLRVAPPGLRAALGRLPDREVAARYGWTVQSIYDWRRRLGIPPLGLWPLQRAVLRRLATQGAQTVSALAHWRGCSRQAIMQGLAGLLQRGLVTWVRTLGRQGRYWVLTAQGWALEERERGAGP